MCSGRTVEPLTVNVCSPASVNSGVLVLQPDFAIFMAGGLVAGSGRFWPSAGGVATSLIISGGAVCLSPL
jgi:hypothetical protein